MSCAIFKITFFFFFFNDTATTEIYTLSLHDALPIAGLAVLPLVPAVGGVVGLLQQPDVRLRVGRPVHRDQRLQDLADLLGLPGRVEPCQPGPDPAAGGRTGEAERGPRRFGAGGIVGRTVAG